MERAEIIGDELVIAISLSALKTALEGSSSWAPADEITDVRTFGAGVAKQIHRETEEDGSTPFHLMLDRCAGMAIEDGCEGVEIGE